MVNFFMFKSFVMLSRWKSFVITFIITPSSRSLPKNLIQNMEEMNLLHILRFPRFSFPSFFFQRSFCCCFVCNFIFFLVEPNFSIKRTIHPFLLLRYVFSAQRYHFLVNRHFFKRDFIEIKENHHSSQCNWNNNQPQQYYHHYHHDSYIRQHLILFTQSHIKTEIVLKCITWVMHKKIGCRYFMI